MKFDYEDVQNIAKLRISLPKTAAAAAVELADQFNEQLDQFQKRMAELFVVPNIEPLASDMKDLEKLGKAQRALKFELVKSLVQLLEARIAIDEPIQAALTEAASEARKQEKALQAEYTERLTQSGLSGVALSHAVANVDVVSKAREASQTQHGNISALNNSSETLPSGSVARIHSDITNRFVAWVTELANLESAPTNPQVPRPQPVWRQIELRSGQTAANS